MGIAFRLPIGCRIARQTLAGGAAILAANWLRSHYENFHRRFVGFFLPKRLRPHFHSIYAYCRISDEPWETKWRARHRRWAPARRLAGAARCLLSRRGEASSLRCRCERAFVICRYSERGPFADLLDGFFARTRRSRVMPRWGRRSGATGRYSANPVGRLVVVCGVVTTANDERFCLVPMRHAVRCSLQTSGRTLGRTLPRGRIYLPQRGHGCAGGGRDDTFAKWNRATPGISCA